MANSKSINNIIGHILDQYINENQREMQYLSNDLLEYIQDTLNTEEKSKVIHTGSKSEGLKNANDIDLMVLSDIFIVVESIDQIPDNHQEGVLLIESTCCEPGFTRLLLHRINKKTDLSSSVDLFTEYEGQQYLDREKFQKYYSLFNLPQWNKLQHGPASVDENNLMDIVLCLKDPVWPTVAKDFLSRTCCIFSKETIMKISLEGCYIVCVPHPQSENSDIEFRLSFSIPERCLISKWTKLQFKFYFLCKSIIKKFFNADVDEKLEKGLCSYFAKTIIFWMIEKHTNEFWEETDILLLTKEFLKILKGYLTTRTCPNYFIPENLMMKSYTELQCKKLLEKLKVVQRDIYLHILGCDEVQELLGQNWEVLFSIYKLVSTIRDDEAMENIFKNIFETQISNIFSVEDQKSDISMWCNSILSLFMRNCQAYFCNPILPLLKIMQDLAENGFGNYNPVHLKYFLNCMGRSIAHHIFEKVCKISDNEIRSELIKVAENCLMRPTDYEYKGILNDYQMTQNVYLGILYNLAGSQEKTIYYFQAALTSVGKMGENGISYNVAALPVCINGQVQVAKAPSFFENDEILFALFEKRHVHYINFDPLVLACYMLDHITKKDHFLTSFARLDTFSHLQFHSPPVHQHEHSTEIESYQYIKYRTSKQCANEQIETYFNTEISCEICNMIS